MRIFFSAFLSFILVAGAAEPVANQQAQRFEARLPAALNYLLYLPRGYDTAGAETWPLVLFLHGAGERGNDLARVADNGLPRSLAEGKELPAIVVSPQCPPGESWSTALLLALLDDLHARHRVDPSRVYLTGISMGGSAVWNLGLRHPDRFAALVPICGRFDPNLLPSLDPARLDAARKLPIWIFHGARDNQMPVQNSERADAQLREFRAEPKLTIYPEAGHDSWSQTYDGPKLWPWLFQQRRP